MVSLLLVVVVACLLANVLSFTSVSPLRVNKRLLRSTTLQCAAAADELLPRLKADWKESMKAKQKVRKQAIESITTAIKQKEVDERIVVTESIAVELMAKLIKQRKESIKCYGEAGREDLVAQEQEEVDVIQSYMPVQLTTEEIGNIIDASIAKLGATSVKDMGKIMADVRPALMGKADIGSVGGQIKNRLMGK